MVVDHELEEEWGHEWEHEAIKLFHFLIHVNSFVDKNLSVWILLSEILFFFERRDHCLIKFEYLFYFSVDQFSNILIWRLLCKLKWLETIWPFGILTIWTFPFQFISITKIEWGNKSVKICQKEKTINNYSIIIIVWTLFWWNF